MANSWAFATNQNTFCDTHPAANRFALKTVGNIDTIHPIEAA
jgi:hypothetical protein